MCALLTPGKQIKRMSKVPETSNEGKKWRKQMTKTKKNEFDWLKVKHNTKIGVKTSKENAGRIF